MVAGALCTGLRTNVRLDHSLNQYQDGGLEVMNSSEVIGCVHRAQKELKPLIDFINAGCIIPNDGVTSYLYAAAQLRANDTTDTLTKLMVAGMQYVREKEKMTCRQNQEN
jgi:mRNA degradation ribonuclease J1/J2